MGTSRLLINIEELKCAESWQAGSAELIGVFFFVFLGAGSVVITGSVADGAMTIPRLIAIALAHGLTITILVAAMARISGGHINPAITLAALATRNISTAKAVIYISAQLLGAIGGAFLIVAVIPGAIDGNLGSHRLGQGVSAMSGLTAEAALTSVLAFAVFATAIDPKGPKRLAPAVIGLAVLVDHLIGVPLTGASMNPARSFGPALVSWTWDSHWIFWLGPIGGGILTAVVYRRVLAGGIGGTDYKQPKKRLARIRRRMTRANSRTAIADVTGGT